jgi:hypothetical protein
MEIIQGLASRERYEKQGKLTLSRSGHGQNVGSIGLDNGISLNMRLPMHGLACHGLGFCVLAPA